MIHYFDLLLCYAENLRFTNCTFEGCDLAFEYSSVKGNIIGDVVSIKNPRKGFILLQGKTEFIRDENDRSHGKFKLVQ